MRWDKVAVPFKVTVNVNDLVTASIHRQLYGLNQYYWEGWDDAGGYFLANKINLEEALKDEDQSIQSEERYDNVMNSRKFWMRWAQAGCGGGAQQGAEHGECIAALFLCAAVAGREKAG